MDSRYKINLRCVVLTTQQHLNKQYVLSLNNDELQLPTLVLDSSIITNIESNLVKFVQQFAFASDIELIPQLIEIKPTDGDDSSIDVIYGFLIRYTDNLNSCSWMEFNLSKEAPYSNMILRVIQKL